MTVFEKLMDCVIKTQELIGTKDLIAIDKMRGGKEKKQLILMNRIGNKILKNVGLPKEYSNVELELAMCDENEIWIVVTYNHKEDIPVGSIFNIIAHKSNNKYGFEIDAKEVEEYISSFQIAWLGDDINEDLGTEEEWSARWRDVFMPTLSKEVE